MSYNHTLLFQRISNRLRENPRSSIRRLACELGISRRTIQLVVSSQAGKPFSALQEESLMKMVRQLFVSQPGLAIKEVSFSVGFCSPRSFARAVKRACGLSPEELRSCVTRVSFREENANDLP
jgi:AraC-like DNA-binding protein